MFKALSPWLIIAWLVSLAAVAAGSGLYAWGARGDKCELDGLRIEQAATSARDAAIEAASEAIAGISVKHTTINRKVEREVVERAVYKECRHTPEMLEAIREAMTP